MKRAFQTGPVTIRDRAKTLSPKPSLTEIVQILVTGLTSSPLGLESMLDRIEEGRA